MKIPARVDKPSVSTSFQGGEAKGNEDNQNTDKEENDTSPPEI
jgi:hypothetical protein